MSRITAGAMVEFDTADRALVMRAHASSEPFQWAGLTLVGLCGIESKRNAGWYETKYLRVVEESAADTRVNA